MLTIHRLACFRPPAPADVWVLFIDGKSLIDYISKFPYESAFIKKLQKRWILRRAVIREAERRCHRQGLSFRGRDLPIYAKELADQMKRKSNLASSLTFFPLRHGAESSRAGDHHDSKRDGQRGSPGLASSKESDDGQPKDSHAEQHQLRNGASIREASLVDRSRAARRRLALTRPGSSSHVIGGKPRLPAKAKARSSASEGGFKVLDNSVERAAQMMEGNTASATASDRGADNMLDQRLERLEARFESLEGKIDRLIATRLPDWYGGGAAAAAPAPGAPFSFVSLLTPKSAAATSEKRLDA